MFTLRVMAQYAEHCGWSLARAQARAGQPTLIAGYLGKGDQFDEAVVALYLNRRIWPFAALKYSSTNVASLLRGHDSANLARRSALYSIPRLKADTL
jgi:hypothetical protein